MFRSVFADFNRKSCLQCAPTGCQLPRSQPLQSDSKQTNNETLNFLKKKNQNHKIPSYNFVISKDYTKNGIS